MEYTDKHKRMLNYIAVLDLPTQSQFMSVTRFFDFDVSPIQADPDHWFPVDRKELIEFLESRKNEMTEEQLSILDKKLSQASINKEDEFYVLFK